jgi:hypothetical protein
LTFGQTAFLSRPTTKISPSIIPGQNAIGTLRKQTQFFGRLLDVSYAVQSIQDFHTALLCESPEESFRIGIRSFDVGCRSIIKSLLSSRFMTYDILDRLKRGAVSLIFRVEFLLSTFQIFRDFQTIL